MNNLEIKKLLEKLHDEIETIEHVDETNLQLLRELERDIDELIDRSDDSTLLERLREGIDRFEVSHPTLTAMLSEMSTILNNAGI